MRLFRRQSADKPAQRDPDRHEALLQQIRQPHGRDELVALLGGTDDGLSVAVRIVHDVAEEAHADVVSQVAQAGGRDYRRLWQSAGPNLRFPLYTLPCGFHPNTHLAAALTVISGAAPRCVRLTDPAALLAHVLELIDLTVAGWEFGKVSVDTDAASLMERLISAATQIRAATGEPPLPSTIRELMRRNNTTDIYDPTGATVVGGVNVGAELRKAFLT
jgi:hypothetical protein